MLFLPREIWRQILLELFPCLETLYRTRIACRLWREIAQGDYFWDLWAQREYHYDRVKKIGNMRESYYRFLESVLIAGERFSLTGEGIMRLHADNGVYLVRAPPPEKITYVWEFCPFREFFVMVRGRGDKLYKFSGSDMEMKLVRFPYVIKNIFYCDLFYMYITDNIAYIQFAGSDEFFAGALKDPQNITNVQFKAETRNVLIYRGKEIETIYIENK